MPDRIAKRLGLAATMSLAAVAAQAQADAGRGASVAAERCSACHDVAPGGAFKQYPPSFTAVAVYRSEDQIVARMLYPPQHATMPQLGFVLTREEIVDVVAYIVSLEGTQGQ